MELPGVHEACRGLPTATRARGDEESAGDDEVPSEFESAEVVLQALAPHWSASPGAAQKLGREMIASASDLAKLDKDDLRELGLSMAERARVLHWAAGALPAAPSSMTAVANAVPLNLLSRQTSDHALRPRLGRSFEFEDAGDLLHSSPKRRSTGTQKSTSALSLGWESGSTTATSVSARINAEEQRLDEIECQADFWCSCFTGFGEGDQVPVGKVEGLLDVRENILEAFFDCTPERVREVFASMDNDSDGRVFTVAELHQGLERCGISGLDHGTLSKVFDRVTGAGKMLHMQSFESILCRLRLARLLIRPLRANLSVVDYTYSKGVVKQVGEEQMRDFFFGHRPDALGINDDLPSRWVHMQQFDLTLLLALTVKYSLHPLSVEDVVEQCQTKIDRFGRNYFVAIELLTLVEAGAAFKGQQPVRVRGQHVTAFCSGPPRLDTLLTICQSEHNFAEDWPGGAAGKSDLSTWKTTMNGGSTLSNTAAGPDWPEKLRQRVLAARSRLRERRADFLLYSVVDLCADSLVAVARAYLARLAWLEEDLRTRGDRSLIDLGEVSLVKLQLAVVARRLRSLQRVVRRACDYSDLHSAGSVDYWRDCADHLEEAHDDALHLAERCDALKAAHEQVMERGQAEQTIIQQEMSAAQAERMNNMLFVLTVATFVFTPLQFVSSVYGMNFVDEQGVPTIPELLNPNGYRYFRVAVPVYLFIAISCAWFCYCRLYRMRARCSSRRGMCRCFSGTVLCGLCRCASCTGSCCSHSCSRPPAAKDP
eukprot:gb/GFBE01040255.1/.p1 GENE.gb/GFBE01040255.1/~~gb/GFBE01040255.1/.p1  ORF type:complete len:769 (+),score=160.45 gb/GFBE01040255.1/:1-2307(+)